MTGILGKYKQYPDERLHYAVDFSQWLDSTEVLTGASYLATPSGLVVDGSYIADGNLVAVFYVSGGTVGEQYKVLVEASTSTGQRVEEVVVFNIISPT